MTYLQDVRSDFVLYLLQIMATGCRATDGTMTATGGTTMWHDKIDGRLDDSNGQQGDRRHNDDSDGWHDKVDERHDDAAQRW